jgi:hypothetical protein
MCLQEAFLQGIFRLAACRLRSQLLSPLAAEGDSALYIPLDGLRTPCNYPTNCLTVLLFYPAPSARK